MSKVIGIPPLRFVHVLDLTTNITRLEIGPKTLCLQTHEQLLTKEPLPCIVIPPNSYCVIIDPLSNYEVGKQVELRHGFEEVRFHKEPFPLYPGETLKDAENFMNDGKYSASIKPLPVIKANQAMRLRANLDFDDDGVDRKAGDMWQLDGPLTYRPAAEVSMKVIDATIIKDGEALLLSAMQDLVDKTGTKRVSGEEWLYTKPGAYLPDVFEKVEKLVKPFTLTREVALHLSAKQTFKDCLGKTRMAGEEWLLTNEDKESYIPEIGVDVSSIKTVKSTVLRRGQFCVVLNPVDMETGKNQLGKRELRRGETHFFLHPGETLEKGIEAAYVLAAEQAVVVVAKIAFEDDTFTAVDSPYRQPGDRWMITGPIDYIPPTEVEIIDRRQAIPLTKNEGIYVRDTQSGMVRAVMGPCSYMLTAYEELWEKELPGNVGLMLKQGGGCGSGDIRKLAYFEQSIDPAMQERDKTRVVTYRCPSNTAVQVYNYKHKTARVIFGPDLIILGPHENFNVLSLSAGKPKKPNALQSLCLMLGPDFMSDIIEVETSDHARLQVKLAFNNHFEWTAGDAESEAKIFSVPDFIGFACRQVGSRIRGQVALTTFDDFHRHSAQIIKMAVFGLDAAGKPSSKLVFEANNLVVTSVDVQSIEPVDLKMRDSLLKSVQMAIEISTNSVERAAAHEARRLEQVAKGTLERQKVINEKEAEKQRSKLFELRAVTAAVESTGQAKAEAEARKEKTLIECQSEIEAAKLKARAAEIEFYAELETQNMLRLAELSFQKEQNTLEVEKTRRLTQIEVDKLSKTVNSLGSDTIAAVANAGPETQAKMLGSLGLKSVLFTDGNNPINLFNTAEGLVPSQVR